MPRILGGRLGVDPDHSEKIAVRNGIEGSHKVPEAHYAVRRPMRASISLVFLGAGH
jgi:hypothetical protein